jgi:hypothetical protein
MEGGLACRGVAPRAVSDGMNSAVFFCFFGILRSAFKRRKEAAERAKALQLAKEQADSVVLADSRKSRRGGRPIMQAA